MTSTGELKLDEITCAYDDNIIVNKLSLSVNAGKIACLLGPSGCGKSTILRAIAGFEPIQTGSITLDGEDLSRPRYIKEAEHRGIGMVFQDYALFPHLSIAENISFGLRKLSSAERKLTTQQMLELVDMQEYATRFPHELSGGQQQRVALARALAPSPKLLLLDEPFSNLDADLRTRLGVDVRNIIKKLELSAILVTHDQREAFAFSDHVAVLSPNGLEQWGSPYELYHEPSNRFVANFIGSGRFVSGITKNSTTFSTAIGEIQGNRAYPFETDSKVELLIRPDDVLCDDTSPHSAEVTSKTFAGTTTSYTLKTIEGLELEASFPSHQDLNIGEKVNFTIDAEHVIAFDS